MRYVVCGADGQLAGRVAENALVNAPAGSKFTFTVYKMERVPKEKKDRWEKAGVRVVEANYDDVAGMVRAFEGGIASTLFQRSRSVKPECGSIRTPLMLPSVPVSNTLPTVRL